MSDYCIILYYLGTELHHGHVVMYHVTKKNAKPCGLGTSHLQPRPPKGPGIVGILFFFSLQSLSICPALPGDFFRVKYLQIAPAPPKTLFSLLLTRLYLARNQKPCTTTALLGQRKRQFTVLKPAVPSNSQAPG